jgi:undecaprenyl-diphosphatase
MQALDWQLFRLVNGLAGRFDALDDFGAACANGLEYVLLLLLASLWLMPAARDDVRYERRAIVVYALAAALIALGINQLIGAAWFRPRPFAHHEVTLLLTRSTDASFPSDHAAGAFALATAVVLSRDQWTRRLGYLMLAGAVLLAVARVYSGTHYPFDVTAGAGIGAGSAWLIWRARPWLDPLLRPLLLPLHRLSEWLLTRAHVAGGGATP